MWKQYERLMIMSTITRTKDKNVEVTNEQPVMSILFNKLDEAIDDMEQDRVQTIDEAWKEIDDI